MKKRKPKWAWWTWQDDEEEDGGYATSQSISITGPGEDNVATHFNLIDTASVNSASGSAAGTTSFPSVNRFKVHAIRGEILIAMTTTTAVAADQVLIHLGIAKCDESFNVPAAQTVFRPDTFADSTRDWMWLHRHILNTAPVIAGINNPLNRMAFSVPVHVKTVRTVREEERIQLVCVVEGLLGASTWEVVFHPYLRILISEIV